MALACAALVGAVTVGAQGAVGLGLRLTLAATGKIHRDFQRVPEAERLDGESTAFLFGTAA